MATDLLLARLKQAGISLAELARLAEFPVEYLRQQVALGFPKKRTRARVEAALGYEWPIWSDRRQLTLRKKCVELHAIDPFLIERAELRALGSKIGADFTGCGTARPKLIEAILQRIAVHSTPTTV
jgi:lambda repressor-like predicted transcriptional regulator